MYWSRHTKILAAKPLRAFSLIELVIVVVIISILTAVAVGVMSSTVTNSKDTQLAQNLSVIRGALDHYQAEHGGNYPTSIPNALLYFTDVNGNLTGAPLNGQTYGPYIGSMPNCPIGAGANMNGVLTDNTLARTDGKQIVPHDIASEPILAAVRSAGCICNNCSCGSCYCRRQTGCCCYDCSSKTVRQAPGGFATAGWRYNPNNGVIRANAGTAADSSGKSYLQY